MWHTQTQHEAYLNGSKAATIDIWKNSNGCFHPITCVWATSDSSISAHVYAVNVWAEFVDSSLSCFWIKINESNLNRFVGFGRTLSYMWRGSSISEYLRITQNKMPKVKCTIAEVVPAKKLKFNPILSKCSVSCVSKWVNIHWSLVYSSLSEWCY